MAARGKQMEKAKKVTTCTIEENTLELESRRHTSIYVSCHFTCPRFLIQTQYNYALEIFDEKLNLNGHIFLKEFLDSFTHYFILKNS